ncbi:MAG: hypothetical protein AAGH46_13420, partial [Bacteroidota bacterium]
FGNYLASIDDYAKLRYGIYTSVIWQRIWYILTDQEKLEISAARLKMETYLNLLISYSLASFFILVIAISRWLDALGYLLLDKLHNSSIVKLYFDWNSILYLVILTILIYAMHGQLLFATDEFKDKIMGFVDIKRLKLLKSLGFSITSKSEEHNLFSKLQRFFEQNNHLPDDQAVSMPED